MGITLYILIFITLIFAIVVFFNIALQIRKRGKLIMSGYYDDPIDSENEQNSLGTQLWKEGIELFGSEAPFVEWLNTPNVNFEYQKPVSHLKNISGIKIIRNAIARLHN